MALAGGLVALTQTGEASQGDRLARTTARTQALATALGAMQALTRGEDPPGGVSVTDASSAFNPNWVRADFLDRTSFKGWLLAGRTAAAFVQDRQDHGLSTDPVFRWADWFRIDLLKDRMTVWGPWPVNVADEAVLEQAFFERTGDRVAAQRFRTGVRQARQGLKRLSAADIAGLAAPFGPSVVGLFSAEAPWNVNTLAEDQLRALLAYPPLALSDPVGAASALVSGRASGRLGPERLAQILKLPADHPLFAYLGTETQVWRVTVPGNQETLVSYWLREPGPVGKADYRPLARTWVPRTNP